jgi:hypothetical protein
MLRKTLKDFTFSDGTTIPAGNLVSIPLISLHRDEVRDSHRQLRFTSRLDRNITLIPAHLMVSASKECATRIERALSTNSIPSMSTTFFSGRDVMHGKIEQPLFEPKAEPA